jgi:hypothetical protein
MACGGGSIAVTFDKYGLLFEGHADEGERAVYSRASAAMCPTL